MVLKYDKNLKVIKSVELGLNSCQLLNLSILLDNTKK